MDRLPSKETDTRFAKYAKLVSRLKAEFPEVATSNYFDDMTLTDYLLGCPQFGLDFEVVPILDCDKIDRQSTMSGEGLWICKKYPWPEGKNGRLSPLIQINLKEIPAPHEAPFPATLLQVWGNETECQTREIPLSDIQRDNPSAEPLNRHNQEHVRWNGFVDRKSGREVIGHLWQMDQNPKMQFPHHWDADELLWQAGDWSRRFDEEREKFSDFGDIIDSLLLVLRDVSDGGPMYGVCETRQTTYAEEMANGRNLCSLNSSDSGGLSILFDGQLNVSVAPCSGGWKFNSYTSR